MRIIFVRHGEPDYANDTLTPKGWREAELLSQRLKNWDIDAFYTSAWTGKGYRFLYLKKNGERSCNTALDEGIFLCD